MGFDVFDTPTFREQTASVCAKRGGCGVCVCKGGRCGVVMVEQSDGVTEKSNLVLKKKMNIAQTRQKKNIQNQIQTKERDSIQALELREN